jgi:hypothetical protein
MRGWVAFVVLAACNVDPISYDGRACPCISGYTCVADRCVRTTTGDGGPDTGGDSGGSGDAGGYLFDDEFGGAAMSASWLLSNGTWMQGGGEATETSSAGGTMIWVNGFDTATDYEVVVGARMTGATPVSDNAMEVLVRVSATTMNYHEQCSWEPGDKFLRIFDVPRTRTNDLDSAMITQTIDPLGSYTMHARMVGATLHCWVDGVAGADLTLTFTGTQLANGESAGSFGVGTYNHTVAFDYIRVTAIP